MPSLRQDPIAAATGGAAHPPLLQIALVTETWPPEVNGVAATIARVADGLRLRGHRVQVVRPRQQDDDDDELEARLGLGPGPGPGLDASAGRTGLFAAPHAFQHAFQHVLTRGMPIPRYPDLRMGLPCKRALLRHWRAQRPDVVHIATEGPLGWSALQAARQLGVPVVSDFRTNFHAYSRHYGVGWLSRPVLACLRAFHNRTACTMVPTEGLRRELQAAGFHKLRVVARGVDTQRFDPARRSLALRASWGAGQHTMVALSVGRLAPEKNLGAVLDAVDGMRAIDPSLRLVFVGDGPQRAALVQRCPDAHFAGLQRGDDLAAHYASADVFLFPSLTETFGNVVPEAMASGLAVVACDRAAAGQLIRHGDNGLLARTGDSAEFCRVARSLAAERAWVRELGQRARASVARLDWRHIVEAVEGQYGAAIGALQPAAAGGLQAVA